MGSAGLPCGGMTALPIIVRCVCPLPRCPIQAPGIHLQRGREVGRVEERVGGRKTERERVCVCIRERAKERERESVCVSEFVSVCE